MADENTDPTPVSVDETPISSHDAKRRNSLEHHLQNRPDRKTLEQRGILDETTAAPALQAAQKELKKRMLADSLNDKLEHRATVDELLKAGKLHDDPRSAAAAAEAEKRYAEAMEDEYAKREGGA